MMTYELDDTEKEALLGAVIDRVRADLNDEKQLLPWKEFTVRVALKVNLGSFGIKYERQGDFTFCARSRDDATAIAGHHVKGEKFSIDQTRIVEIVGSLPAGDPHK